MIWLRLLGNEARLLRRSRLALSFVLEGVSESLSVQSSSFLIMLAELFRSEVERRTTMAIWDFPYENVYASDLSDEEWRFIRPLIPPSPPVGADREVDTRRVLGRIALGSALSRATNSRRPVSLHRWKRHRGQSMLDCFNSQAST